MVWIIYSPIKISLFIPQWRKYFGSLLRWGYGPSCPPPPWITSSNCWGSKRDHRRENQFPLFLAYKFLSSRGVDSPIPEPFKQPNSGKIIRRKNIFRSSSVGVDDEVVKCVCKNKEEEGFMIQVSITFLFFGAFFRIFVLMDQVWILHNFSDSVMWLQASTMNVSNRNKTVNTVSRC